MTAPPLWLAICGMLAAPLLWAANVQLGQVLPYAECGVSLRPSFWLSCLAAVVSLAGAWLSWRGATVRAGTASAFVLRAGAGVALIFTFALLLQGMAGWVLTGCER